MEAVQDLNIRETSPLAPPRQLRAETPPDAIAFDTVVEGRVEVERILSRRDDRMLAIVGPCCIHDPDAALEYARKLNQLRRELRDRLCIFMRCYFEKPRTVVGWKGLMYDPHLDGSGDLEEGLRLTRRLLLDIGRMGLPVATEMLNPITPQYTADLISWACIGARTIESQSHREMASGLSMPVGIKNSTEGNLQVAVDAIRSARQPHTFLGTDEDGRTSLVRTRGNPGTHIVRGRPTTMRPASPRPVHSCARPIWRKSSSSTAATAIPAANTSVSEPCGMTSSPVGPRVDASWPGPGWKAIFTRVVRRSLAEMAPNCVMAFR